MWQLYPKSSDFSRGVRNTFLRNIILLLAGKSPVIFCWGFVKRFQKKSSDFYRRVRKGVSK
jgi:hypothetical protein